ncbi:hypothetical protein CONPUDRAFT_147462 [Coniophora puteana RWD-64-598 SS2]|uniref:F-box domain-containing protein n=1 Tax=Coniophora puteana (strain RWD-64-598) TaxID=741705 RepID=A0A5M3M6Z2_CONPW|nr:uncharacterized protein CONPUDRAFT_147462 [Coniophora puteana RWD-64-598 SS2]EIW74833.1 hypothetical protein CONPUDRAFT_147462 [Coniophora puteana RWD-64-598 SS2]
MHRVLLVAELLDNIFGNLSAEFDRLFGGPNDGTLLALATTCRTFKEPALNALWENLLMIDSLIKCLHKDAWEPSVDQETGWARPAGAFVVCLHSSGCQSLAFMLIAYIWQEIKRPLTPSDWLIIRKYAPRVRHLYQVSLGAYRSAPTKLWVLSLSLAPPDAVPLLPNLKLVEWTGMRPDTAPYMRTFLTASLESLCYGVGSTIPDIYLLSSVGAFCPSIKDASVYSYRKIGGVEAFSLSVCRWNYLRVLRCEELTDEALVHIAGLPNLQELNIALYPETPFRAMRAQLRDTPFPDLTSLHVIAADLNVFAAFVCEFELSLAKVTVFVSERASACSDGVAGALKAISKSKRALTHVEIAEEDDSSIPIPANHTFPLQNTVIDMSTLRPLLGFSKLRVLDFETRCSVVLSDAELIDLARALPLLGVPCLNSMHGWNAAPPAVTFYGLCSVARLCPFLCRLGIEFDGISTEKIRAPPNSGGVSAVDEEDVLDYHNFSLEELWVGNSRVEDPETVARLLYEVMPELTGVFGWCEPPGVGDDVDGEWQMHEGEYNQRWKEVGDIIAKLRLEDDVDGSMASGSRELSSDGETDTGEEE